MEHYKTLQKHYEKCLEEHGPVAQGMDWPNQADLDKRFEVLTDIVEGTDDVSLLDLGCGVGLLLDFLKARGLEGRFHYTGADISNRMIEVAKGRFPRQRFEVRDILVSPYEEGQFDYIVINGVLNEKQEMTQSQMIDFAQQFIASAFRSCRKGIAFNVMSSHVDWKRDDLFHWELDSIVNFMVRNCSRKIRIMMDYGLYEYIVHLKK
jgi:SAM-dependent methyltransferase